MHHIFAQHFHPEALLERVRDVGFYRRPRTLFKGFKVPDWATSDRMNGWQVDAYSRQAWDNAMAEFNSEWTPMQFFGERQEPNIIEWFRLEQFGKGSSSRLFYNEVPNPTWMRHSGHLYNKDASKEEINKEMYDTLYSFTNADQDKQIHINIDTTTEEGRKAFKAEYEALSLCAPEIVRMEDMVYPHEVSKFPSTEPHFQRIWQYYRDYAIKQNMAIALEKGLVSDTDVALANKFLGTKQHLSIS